MSTTTVTSKGQSTIPGELRLLLNIFPGDKISYQMTNIQKKQFMGEVISTQNVVEELGGSLNPSGKIKYIPYHLARKIAGKALTRKYSLIK